MAERSLVNYLLRGMAPHWVWPVKHNDNCTGGIADVSAWMTGPGTVWIELKALDAWPVRPGTPVRFGLEELQRLFLQHRRGWLFCRVAREYLLFDSGTTATLIDTPAATQAALRHRAAAVWRDRVGWAAFAQNLSGSTRIDATHHKRPIPLLPCGDRAEVICRDQSGVKAMPKFEVRECSPGNAILFPNAKTPCVEIVFVPGTLRVSAQHEHGAAYVLTERLTSDAAIDEAVKRLTRELESAAQQAKDALKVRAR